MTPEDISPPDQPFRPKDYVEVTHRFCEVPKGARGILVEVMGQLYLSGFNGGYVPVAEGYRYLRHCAPDPFLEGSR